MTVRPKIPIEEELEMFQKAKEECASYENTDSAKTTKENIESIFRQIGKRRPGETAKPWVPPTPKEMKLQKDINELKIIIEKLLKNEQAELRMEFAKALLSRDTVAISYLTDINHNDSDEARTIEDGIFKAAERLADIELNKRKEEFGIKKWL